MDVWIRMHARMLTWVSLCGALLLDQIIASFHLGSILDGAWGLEAGMVARILSITSRFFAWKMPVLCAKGRTKLSKY